VSYTSVVQLVRSDRVEHSGSISNHRGGGIDFVRLHRGRRGSPDNFEWSLIETTPEFSTPRHRHNFDQLHVVLEGAYSWGPDRWMHAGSLGYFPEGTFYGPQQGGRAVRLALQFGGASGQGFMDYDQLREGNVALAQRGEFTDGVFTWTDAAGTRHRADGYEAIWEHVAGRPVRYPAPRFDTPIVVHPAAMAWRPSRREPGVAVKHAGTFGECRTSVRLLRIDAGSGCMVDASRSTVLQYVLSGAVRIGEDRDDAPSGAAICWRPGEDGWLTASSTAELIEIRLPELGEST
jgi:hypothetical protein